MKENMEHAIAEFKLELSELKSGVVILQAALGNDSDVLENRDIIHFIEIMLSKIDVVMKNFEEFEKSIS